MLRRMGNRGCYVHTSLLHACRCYVISSTVAKLQASLQAKELDLASIPVLVDSTHRQRKRGAGAPPPTFQKVGRAPPPTFAAQC
jgi:hypothetical protein